MADEVDLNLTPEPKNDSAPRQLSDTEVRAAEQGWVPQDEWQGDPEAWRPAKEFLDRGELFKKIEEQKRELKMVRAALEDFGKHHAKVKEIEYERALKDLRAQKRDALVDGDADAVIEIDDKIDNLKEQQRVAATPEVPQVQEPHPAFVAWEQRNQWYQNERAMKRVADGIAQEMVEAGERNPVKILEEVDRQIRKEFPHKFNNPNREKAGAVEGSTKVPKASKEDSVDLSDDERRIMNRVVSTGAITKEQWLKEYKAIKSRGA